MDKGMKTWLRAIWMRQSGGVPSSGSSKKVATSAMQTLLWDEGVGADNEAELGLGRGSPSGAGITPVCALVIKVDHLVGVKEGAAGIGNQSHIPTLPHVAACGRVGICA